MFSVVDSRSTMKLALFVSALAGVSAFAPSKTVSSSSALSESKADLEALAGKLNPTLKFYDPLVSTTYTSSILAFALSFNCNLKY